MMGKASDERVEVGMKRDARIGLAVVLVFGLAVTLLVGRALVKHGADSETDGEVAAGGAQQYNAEGARVDGVDPANVPAAAHSNAGPNPNADATGTRPPEVSDPAVQRFIEDQNRRLGVEAAPPVAQPPTPQGGRTTQPEAAPPQPTTGKVTTGNPPAQKTGSEPSATLDHEQPGAGAPVAEATLPSEYGYTVAGGDNVWKIASKVYGDSRFTQKIVDANPGVNTKNMKVGTVIKIPTIPQKTILMHLPSFADAQKGAGNNAGIASNNKTDKPDGPVTANITTNSPDKAATTTQTHKIASGETLGSIAQKYYGSSGPKTIARIVAANKGLDATKLKIGQELTIPAKK